MPGRMTAALNRFGIVIATSLLTIVASHSTASGTVLATDAILAQTRVLRCTAEDMCDEIKIHFRGTRCYGKLLAINARIKIRSAAVNRRYLRDQDYHGLRRDISKLNELAYSLSDAYCEAIEKSNAGKGRPPQGDTRHVVDKLGDMIVTAESLHSTLLARMGMTGDASYSSIEYLHVPEYVPNQDIAPAVSPPDHTMTPRLEYPTTSELQLESPTSTGQPPHLQSVLEK